MIFVTVGTQLPFDRLICAVEAWAARTGRRDILAQIGPTTLRPQFIQYRPFLSPTEFTRHFTSAELVIAHAGMGSILSAMTQGKPILVMPRRAHLNEHRNDHQMGTARRFKEMGRFMVAIDEHELDAQLSQLESMPGPSRIGFYASSELLAKIREFIADDSAIRS